MSVRVRGEAAPYALVVRGFNPNLHPLLGRAEIGEDPRWAGHTPDALELFHDQEHDELRLPRLLSRHPGHLRLTEALPVPSGQVLEVVAETYRRAG
ncbi:hypothetical protein V1227_01975 [Lentzea sp. DG1S-22]|uniref:hypothetical protein n=1 Tax=Lentzea sp. DG1S-22 TaxID=3108822 RepID=UPI002E76FB9A|nr:hypothetical protein [Lentzea sp. DG1S-22]WVH81548.1 hypothetical protein V1227_01975 [Lentzea sp. DG1S-22]